MSFFKNLTDAYPILKILGNRYVIVLCFFTIWMLFLDNTSYMEHRVLDQQLDELEDNKKYYQEEIKKDEENIKLLKNPDQIEKYGVDSSAQFHRRGLCAKLHHQIWFCRKRPPTLFNFGIGRRLSDTMENGRGIRSVCQWWLSN